MALCPSCGAALAYEGQRHCAACGADLTAAAAPAPAATPARGVPETAAAQPPAAPPSTAPLAPPPPPWQPTHRVSIYGMPAWDGPDSSAQPSVMLPPSLDLVIVQFQNYSSWTQVRSQNGWQGWVDGQQLVALPWFGMQPVPSKISRRTKVGAIVGGLALITCLLGAAVFAYTAAHSPKTPVDGRWDGVVVSAGTPKLLVQFWIASGQSGQVSVDFWDPADNFYSWTCADSRIDNGTFKAMKCLSDWGGDAPTVDVGGTFDATDDIEGTYQVTVLGKTYSGTWSGMPA